MERRLINLMTIVIIFLFVGTTACRAQQVALKTNLLYDAATTPNLGLELGLNKKHTLQMFYGLNPWEFGSGDDRKFFKHWVVNPEFRHWFCHRFNGSFVGVHALGGQFNASNLDVPFGLWDDLKDHRLEGWYVGGGLSYGYQWVLSRHWNLEAAIGLGVIYFDYEKFQCGHCGKKLDDGDKLYLGPTKAALSVLYLF